jgi:hypothetical protein
MSIVNCVAHLLETNGSGLRVAHSPRSKLNAEVVVIVRLVNGWIDSRFSHWRSLFNCSICISTAVHTTRIMMFLSELRCFLAMRAICHWEIERRKR